MLPKEEIINLTAGGGRRAGNQGSVHQEYRRHLGGMNCRVGRDTYPADNDKALKISKENTSQPAEEEVNCLQQREFERPVTHTERHPTPTNNQKAENENELPFYIHQTDGNGII